MATGSRIQPRPDLGRLGAGAAGENDTRTWVELARIDEDPDAVRWDDNAGWLVDVTFHGGPLDQVGPVVCRVASWLGSDRQGQSEPVTRGSEVIVVLPSGDPNDSPIILGYTSNGGGCRPPQQSEDQALSRHLLRTPFDWRLEAGATVHLQATAVSRLVAPRIDLADEDATASYVRGEDLKAALDSFAQSLQAAFAALVPVGPPATPVTAAQAAAALTAATTAGAALVGAVYLSTRIRGE